LNCQGKHTTWDPPEKEFSCPKCGAKCGDFFIEEKGILADDDCGKLHVDDYCICNTCGFGITGQKFVANEMRKRDLVKCPCCQGAGAVIKAEAARWKRKGS
jgi:hypothetical protein